VARAGTWAGGRPQATPPAHPARGGQVRPGRVEAVLLGPCRGRCGAPRGPSPLRPAGAFPAHPRAARGL
jgi:hypothetical protein